MINARLVAPGTATDAEWQAVRAAGITASEIPAILGVSSWSSPYALYWQKTGDLPWQDDTDRLALGRHLEPYIVQRFAARFPGLSPTGSGRAVYAHPHRGWQLATPDRILFDDDSGEGVATLECKSWGSFDGWGDDGGDEVPVAVRCQALWQADVMGVTRAMIAGLFLPSAQLRVYELALDDLAVQRDLALMREEGQAFHERIFRRDPPEPDWRPATGQALRRLHPLLVDKDVTVDAGLAADYLAAVECEDIAGKVKAGLANRLLEAIGDGRRAVLGDGTRIATRSVSEPRRVNTAQLREQYPAVAAEVTHKPDHPEVKLTPARPKPSKEQTPA